MKVSRDVSSQPIKQMQHKQQVNDRFQQLVQSQTEHLKTEELQQLMDKISDQGERLARFRSFKDLVRFKHLIKGFLEKTVYDSYELDSSFSFNPRGNSKQLVIVKKVDRKLADLTEQVMSREEKSVDLLDVIGEIKGLLINLYT